MRPYVELNTRMRRECPHKFGKDFYKLMVNSVYGKSQENLKNRIHVRVVRSREQALRLVCKAGYMRCCVVSPSCVVIQSAVKRVLLNRPLFVGFVVLEESKRVMYKFHYTQMRVWYPTAELCFTDTDSLLYYIRTADVYADLAREHVNPHFDFSNLSAEPGESHGLFTRAREYNVGLFKDELRGVPLYEWIGLRSKMYSMLFFGEVYANAYVNRDWNWIAKAKGTKRGTMKNFVRHSHYVKSLYDMTPIRIAQNAIQSRKHRLGTYAQRRPTRSVASACPRST